MKFMLYIRWGIYLYRIDMGGMPCYFAAVPELNEVRMSSESQWDAFEKLRRHIDGIESQLADVESNEAEFKD